MISNRIARILFLVGVVLFFGNSIVHSRAINEKESESIDDTQGLYNSSDRVVVLNSTNFKNSVYNGNKAWLVEFYNSWCGHCIRFAPIWKSLAHNIYVWKNIVAVAAIDCANDENTPLCRDYEVMSYPTVKFFPVSTNVDFLGLTMNKNDDINKMIESLTTTLIEEQLRQSGGPNWPNIVPYRGAEPETLWQLAPSKAKYQLLIFEEPKSVLGAEVILDLHNIETAIIRRVTSENIYLSVTNKVTKYPSLIAIDRDNLPTFLKINSNTREGIRESISEFLKSKNLLTDIYKESFNEEHDNKNIQDRKFQNIGKFNHHEDRLYQLDLETALHKALNNEIPRTKIISDEKLKALQAFLKVLTLYFPTSLQKSKSYLQDIKEYVEIKNNITGKEFKEFLKLKEKEFEPVFSGPHTYIGCKGSSPNYRGYPCGLWTLFHTLTVTASDLIDLYDENHPSVLIAMHGYIKNFFGCSDCSNHFQEMAQKRNIFDSRSADDTILWLWKAHNEVNERLSGDDTEDPEYKKIQYPSTKNCPRCRFSSGHWNEEEVLKYLKMKYSKININFQGLDQKLIQVNNHSGSLSSGASTHKLGWDFTFFDISICVVIYATSVIILILVFLKFAVKRTTRKKISFQNLFNTKVKC